MRLIYFVLFGTLLVGCGASATKKDNSQLASISDQSTEIAQSEAVSIVPDQSTKPTSNEPSGLTDLNGKPFPGRRYKIDMPTGWDIAKSGMRTDIMAVSPKSDANDSVQENINVVLETVPASLTGLDDVVDYNIKDMKTHLKAFQVFSVQYHALPNGVETRLVKYGHTYAGFEFTAYVAFVFDNQGVYVITCTALPDTFTEFDNDFMQTINSFRFE